MNRKGFTLIELMVVIVIIGIILVIATPSLSNVYKNSKLKSEQIFIGRLSEVIDSYVKLNSDIIGFAEDGVANKNQDNSSYEVNIYKGNITFQDIIDDRLLSSEDYINSGNKTKTCNTNTEIEVYKDSDYVYCYKVNKESLNCLSDDYKSSIMGDYVIDTCIWSK